MSTKIQGQGKGGVSGRGQGRGQGKGGVPGQGKGGVPGQGKAGVPGQGKGGVPGQGKTGVPGQGKGKNKPILKPIIFVKKNPKTDFKALLENDIKNNILSLYIFNDNVEHHKTTIAGDGNATIRPFNKYGSFKPTRSAGISTGENGVGFKTLQDSQNKIDSDINEIKELLQQNKYNFIFFSKDKISDTLGTGNYNPANEVKQYIYDEIQKLPNTISQIPPVDTSPEKKQLPNQNKLVIEINQLKTEIINLQNEIYNKLDSTSHAELSTYISDVWNDDVIKIVYLKINKYIDTNKSIYDKFSEILNNIITKRNDWYNKQKETGNKNLPKYKSTIFDILYDVTTDITSISSKKDLKTTSQTIEKLETEIKKKQYNL